MNEKQAQQKAMQEAEAAAQAKAQENAALLEEENNKKALEAIAKANRIANGQMNDEDYYEEGDEEEQLSNVQKWLLTAPTVESIEQAGAEVLCMRANSTVIVIEFLSACIIVF